MKKTDMIEALCEHLRRIGLNATVDSPQEAGYGPLGSVRVANRNIDLVILCKWATGSDSGCGDYVPVGPAVYQDKYGCYFAVQAKVEGLEDRLKAKGKPVRKSFLSRQFVDFKWKGKELAQILNSDAAVKSLLLSQRRPTNVEIIPFKEELEDSARKRLEMHGIAFLGIGQFIQIGTRAYTKGYDSPADAFPTIETFEACDRIAKHIRNIANVLPLDTS